MAQNLIVWDEKFAIGIPLIDGEHKKLVTLCNNLYNIIMNENFLSDVAREEGMREALMECVDYSNFHFKHEEELMELCSFEQEKFKEHKSAHEKFSEKVFEEIQEFDSGDHELSFDFVKFLYEWILTHIAHMDRLYVDTLNEYLSSHPEISIGK